MKISIDYAESIGDNIIAVCNSNIGTIRGIWCGKNLPSAKSVHYVEFSFDDIDCGNVKVLHGNAVDVSVSLKNNTVLFKGICEDYDGEVHFIRFADDWLQMIYIDGNNQIADVGDNVAFLLDYRQIRIYPYDII